MSGSLAEKIERLQSLDEREVNVLNFIMADPNIKINDVAKQIHMAESSTRNLLTSIFNKLEVPNDERDKRGFLVREYSDAYREQYLKFGQIPSTPTVPPQIQVTPPKRQINRTVLIVSILGGFLLISFVVIGILLSTLKILNPPQVASAATEPVNVAPVIIPTETVIPEPTDEPTQKATDVIVILPEPTDLPTSTSVPPTQTPKPQPTPKPTDLPPAIPLPFVDTFDSGLDSNWKVLSGDWVISNGDLTRSNKDNEWSFIALDDPRWTDYSVKVKVNRGNDGETAVFIRYNNNQQKQLAFWGRGIRTEGAFVYYESGLMIKVAGTATKDLPPSYTLQVDVLGNNFTARVNGIAVQTLSLTGFPSGGVVLGLNCHYDPCSSFSEFELTSN